MTYYTQHPAAPPVHPNPGFFETTIVEDTPDSERVTSADVERILSYVPWSFEDANRRVIAAMREAGWVDQEGVLISSKADWYLVLPDAAQVGPRPRPRPKPRAPRGKTSIVGKPAPPS